ncbi:MAG TPA: response regulator [Methylomirabilota bacterium]|jgi:CheY-like chemotaxis protein|nr:response regulator [Methylomirabilota bacterium]
MTAETPGPALLVVDDNEDNRYTLVQRLRRLGYTNVVTAIDGRGALERLGTQDFDLVLLDVMMPQLNGYEVLERIRADDRLRHVPVIMISAVDQVESVVRCIELGAEDYLPKPFNPVILRARVTTCLEKKRLRDQELRYLADVARVTSAAAALEDTKFEVGMLADVERREDELGQLARVFVRMAGEVAAREAKLRQEIHTLRIEIDEAQKARQVSEITETEYFQTLQQKARALRERRSG